MEFLPIFLDVKQKLCLVVGGGEVGARKFSVLLQAGANVRVVAPEINDAIKNLTNTHSQCEVLERVFEPSDLDGVTGVVFACTSSTTVNTCVASEARARKILVNSADDKINCEFIMPAIVDRSPVCVAVSSSGASPVLARRIKTAIETALPSGLGAAAKLMEDFRSVVSSVLKTAEQRRKFWEDALDTPQMLEYLSSPDSTVTVNFMEELLQRHRENLAEPPAQGHVFLVGAGPGDPDLLTVKAVRVLQHADVLVTDRLVPEAILAIARKDARRIYVGKERGNHSVPQPEINKLLVTLASEGKTVCRVKGGDPYVFGRGGEEVEELVAAGISYQVVPGITAASGCATSSNIPLTLRKVADSCRFLTGHDLTSMDWPTLVAEAPICTLVWYMALANLAEIATKLIQHGLPPSHPVAIISQGTTVNQKVVVGCLGNVSGLLSSNHIESPALVYMGNVVSQYRGPSSPCLDTSVDSISTSSVTSSAVMTPRTSSFMKQFNSVQLGGAMASLHVSTALSELCFVYGRLFPQLPVGTATINAFGQRHEFLRLDTPTTASGGSPVLLGAATQGEMVSAVLPAYGIPPLISTMTQFTKQSLPLVAHGISFTLDREGRAVPSHHNLFVGNNPHPMVMSSTPQECHDMAIVAHILAVRLREPVIHVMDFHTAHQEATVEVIESSALPTLLNDQFVASHRERFTGLTSSSVSREGVAKPSNQTKVLRSRRVKKSTGHGILVGAGEALNWLTGWQTMKTLKPAESSINGQVNPPNATIIDYAVKVMRESYYMSGRRYSPFEFTGRFPVDICLLCLGQDSVVAKPVIDLIGTATIGVITARMINPWSEQHFRAVVPSTCTTVIILDRTVDQSAFTEDTELTTEHSPLYNKVKASLPNGSVAVHSLVLPETPLNQNDLKIATESFISDDRNEAEEAESGISLFSSLLPVVEPVEEVEQVGTPRTPKSPKEMKAVLSIPSELSDVARTTSVGEGDSDSGDQGSLGDGSLDLGNQYLSQDDLSISSLGRSLEAKSQAALCLMFPEAHDLEDKQRPDLGSETYNVKVTNNQRLTPQNYDRNVFHIEFDLSECGMKYNLGQALGVYPRNELHLVEDFLAWYGINPEQTVQVPVNNGQSVEVTTARKLFTNVLDLFGQPSTKFYEHLSEYCSDANEKLALERLGSKEGKRTAIKRRENFVTFADTLKEFPSAKPDLFQLVDILPQIKPRIYSIASSQKIHPTAVQLLVVEVGWEVKGELRWGLASRFLAGLVVGDEVSVCLKPSVMVLPESHATPIVMAGLGTGLAPFRAFIEERSAAKAAGEEVGDISLYFGARYRNMEYLYGEELESYSATGLITNLRLAFSRDTKKKVYIQHLMNEDKVTLTKLLHHKKGHFYLCGPTWPVPDVHKAISESLQECLGIAEDESRNMIENMKENERYVLEVY